MPEKTIEVSFDFFLKVVDLQIAEAKKQIEDNKKFIRDTEIMLLIDKCLNDRPSLIPLLCLLIIFHSKNNLISLN